MKACAKIQFGTLGIVFAVFLLLCAVLALEGAAVLAALAVCVISVIAGLGIGISGYIASQKEP